MKILMYHARAGGHNILPFLEYFEQNDKHELHFAYSNDCTFENKNAKIKLSKIGFGPSQLFRTIKLLRQPYDLIWYHGGHSSFILFFFTLIKSPKSLFVFNIWNEWLIQKAQKGGINGYLFSRGVKKSDIIQCNWYGTKEAMTKTGWAKRIEVFYWGLQKDYFKTEQTDLRIETKDFISKLPKEKIKFFFPKSISPASRHDLIIEACRELKKSGIKNYIVFFWLGNINNPEILSELKSKIKRYELQEEIVVAEHGFLPFSDIIAVWNSMDVGLQIAENDQLSTSFIEPQFFQKEIIASDIRPYQIYNELFNAGIQLTKLEVNELKERFGDTIRNLNKIDPGLIEKRKRIVEDNFHFDDNIGKTLDFYGKLIKES